MPSVVVLDACALYPQALRDFLIRLARAGLFRAKVSEQILDELKRSLERQYPDRAFDRLITLLNAASPTSK